VEAISVVVVKQVNYVINVVNDIYAMTAAVSGPRMTAAISGDGT
jgi:hypothetical protein